MYNFKIVFILNTKKAKVEQFEDGWKQL